MNTVFSLKTAFPRFPILALCLALLAACSSGIDLNTPEFICPATGIVEGTGVVTRFVDGSDFAQEDVLYTGHISDLTFSCEEERDGILTTISFDVVASLGPAATTEQVSLPYFVAVTRNGNRQEVVAKDVYNAILDFSGGTTRARVTETIEQHLVLENNNETLRYEILIGFQLADDELIFNLSR